MENHEGSFIEKIKGNPFLTCLIVVVVIVAFFVIYTLHGAMEEKIAALEAEKTSATTEVSQLTITEPALPENAIEVANLKKYSDKIEEIVITKETKRIAVTITYKDKEALLDAHYAQNDFSFDVAPVFYFYINNGTQIEMPGEIRLMGDDKTVTYYLIQTEDFVNAVALTENETITLDNIMDEKFNLYIRHKTKDGVGRTLCGTYNQTVEQFNSLHLSAPAEVFDINEDIDIVKYTACEEFVWFDIYFKDETAYNQYNNNLKQHFICYGYEYGGKLYKFDFIVTEYDEFHMLRCKVDEYALSQILKEMNVDDKLTVKEFFEEIDFSVWASDYETQVDLFCINESVEIRDKLNKSTSFDD